MQNGKPSGEHDLAEKRLVQFVDFPACNAGLPLTLPYATSGLRAYAESFADIRAAFDFAPTIVLRDRFEAMAERIGRPDLLALSCYVWNFNASMALAAEVKRRSPQTIVVIGGPHPKYGDDTVFAAHPAVDALIQGEGEVTFLAVLRSIAATGRLAAVDGITVRDPDDGTIRVSQHRAKAGDLSAMPSPYTIGLMDGPLVDLRGQSVGVAATLESNRGCPFQCTFCDWGSLGSKMAEFPIERVFADIDWIAENGIETLWMADSNFGMRKRDRDIAIYLAEAHLRTGYPRRLIASTSKNSSRAVLEVVRPLAQTPMFRGLTLSFQSHSDSALRGIKRQNIKHSTFFELLEDARSSGTSTYTDMILGLPEETLDSFKAGLTIAIEGDPQGVLIVFRCVLLPNAELASAEDRKRFGLRTAWLPMTDPPDLDPRYTETYEFVVGTDAMPEQDWREAVEYAWLVLLLHTFRLGQPVLLLLRQVVGLDFVDIFDSMLGFLRRRPDSVLGAQLQLVQHDTARFIACRDPSNLPPTDQVPWRADPDAAARITRAKLAVHHDQCAAELTMLAVAVAKAFGHTIETEVRDDLFVMLQQTTYRPVAAGERVLDFATDLPGVLAAAAAGEKRSITHRPSRYRLMCTETVSAAGFQARINDYADRCDGLEPFDLCLEAERLAG